MLCICIMLGSAWCRIMSCSNRTRPLLGLSSEYNWWDWAEHSKKKHAHYYSRYDKIILLHDNTRPHVAAPVKTYLETLKGKFYLTHHILQILLLPTTTCSEWRMACLSSTLHHIKIPKIINDWIASKDEAFFRRSIHMLSERWEKVVASDGHYFE